MPLNVRDQELLETLIQECDVAVSLLPATQHVQIAKLCVRHRRNMVTTSYVSPEMRELDREARASGVVILNELGVDPGIDHMSAMRVIDAVKAQGGRVTSFRSYCGGLPAPEANDNPLGYKFSWSPRAVLVAARSAARYLERGNEVRVDGKVLFSDFHILDVDGLAQFEAYPNRDSLEYIGLYGLEGIPTMFRGTLRYPGHCETWKKMSDLGLFDPEERTDLGGGTYAEFMGKLAETTPSPTAVAQRLDLRPDSPPMQKLVWLGLFTDERTPEGLAAPIDILAGRMLEKCPYKPRERDMIVLVHRFEAEYADGRRERLSSTLVDFGIPGGDSSMARTVSLPAAIATRMVAERTFTEPGVHIPVDAALYEPVLSELDQLGIACKEKTEQIADA
jgi:saccharopine dehydrogenase-like NADP-dependent oxidoreductase